MIINKSKSASYPNQFQRSATVVKKPEVPSSLVPQGKITIIENGQDIDVAKYALADVDVEMPQGKITITENGQDIDIAEYALADVAVEGGSGGGGSSDFYKAEVTIINNERSSVFSILPNTMEDDDTIAFRMSVNGVQIDDLGYEPSTETTDTYYIYAGKYMVGYSGSITEDTGQYSVTGNAEVITVEGMPVIIITGDCTITIA